MLIFVNHDDMRSLELMEECVHRGIYVSDQLNDIKYADIIYMGAKGIDRKNRLMMNTETRVIPDHIFKNLKKDCILLTLIHNDYLEELSNEYHFHYCALLDKEEFIRKNSILTAEGLISYLIVHRRYPIYHSCITVLGYGHCAQPIIQYLKAMGAKVTVAVRNKKWKDNIESLGCCFCYLKDVVLSQVDILINTIPSIIIEKEKLDLAKKDILIVDIASYPYGIDHHYALSIGLNSQILSSIPNKYAYGYAGKMIADEIEGMFKNE